MTAPSLSTMVYRMAASIAIVEKLSALAEELSRRASEAGNLEIAEEECALRKTLRST